MRGGKPSPPLVGFEGESERRESLINRTWIIDLVAVGNPPHCHLFGLQFFFFLVFFHLLPVSVYWSMCACVCVFFFFSPVFFHLLPVSVFLSMDNSQTDVCMCVESARQGNTGWKKITWAEGNPPLGLCDWILSFFTLSL